MSLGAIGIIGGCAGCAATARNAAGDSGGYLVVALALEEAGDDANAFRNVAQRAAAFHRGALIELAGRDYGGLERTLKERQPRNVLFVVPPAVLDCNLHRRIFLMCGHLDEDVFADFAFGYLTARDGEGLRRLWERSEKLHRRGLAGKTWVEASVASGITSTVYPDAHTSITTAAGFRGPHIYWADLKSDLNVVAFVERVLPELEKADVIALSGNGDPQGIWLFDDQRNVDSSKHWEYAPEKVGHDPAGEMPRISADRLAKLQLKSPIVWSGTCHSATPCNVYVEGDIVSTFGRCEKTVLHQLKPAESMCLAMLEAGAAAFLAPIGPNHGYSMLNETQFALQHGASLGEVVRSTYNDVLLASRGRPELRPYVPGEEHREPATSIMQAGGSNRILIGDPALSPFTPTNDPLERVTVERRVDGFDVQVEWKDGFHPLAWDIYGNDRQRDGRVYVRVALDELGGAGAGRAFAAEVSGSAAAGTALPFSKTYAEFEAFHGRRYLHLQANAPRPSFDHMEIRVTFRVKRSG
ncbi:MAG: hypothetical protein CHACPFDD_02388 [Phycisphaerae bacterium]|nr:hypothetical protein [Phycisphaerae bacterium]